MPDASNKPQVEHCCQLAITFARQEETDRAIEQLAKGLSLVAEQVDYVWRQDAYFAAELSRLNHPIVIGTAPVAPPPGVKSVASRTREISLD